jgi:hypothetical protein
MSTTIDHTSALTGRNVPTKGSRATLQKVLLACGIGSSAAYVAANVAGALRGGGYSSVNQSVSELTAIHAPPDPLPFPLRRKRHARARLRDRRGGGGRPQPTPARCRLAAGRGGRGRRGLAVHPMHTRAVLAADETTWTDTAHLTVVGATTLQIMGAMGFAAAAFGKRFRRYSVGSLVTMLVAGGLTATQQNAVAANLPTPWNGVYERISIGGYLLWRAVLAGALLRASGRAQTRGQAA